MENTSYRQQVIILAIKGIKARGVVGIVLLLLWAFFAACTISFSDPNDWLFSDSIKFFTIVAIFFIFVVFAGTLIISFSLALSRVVLMSFLGFIISTMLVLGCTYFFWIYL